MNLKKAPSVAISAILVLAAAAQSEATVFFVGAQMFKTTATGARHPVEPQYQFSTNISTGHASFPMDMVGDVPDAGVVGTAIAFELQLGDNVFQYSK